MSETTIATPVVAQKPYAITEAGSSETVKSLLPKLKWAAKLISSKMVVPVTENFLFSKGFIYATDLQTTAIWTTGIKGQFLVPAKKFIKILSALDKEDVISFKAEGKDGDMVCVEINGKTTIRFAAELHTDFPVTPKCPITVGEIIHKDAIDDLVIATKYTSQNELRPAMQGVFVDGKYIVSTNGHLMYRRPVNNILIHEEDYTMLLPKKSIEMIAEFEHATIKRNDTKANIMFKESERAVILRNIDDKFPQYEKVWPLESFVNLTLDRKELMSSLNLAMQVCHPVTHKIQLTTHHNGTSAKISGEDLDFNTEFMKDLGATNTGWGKKRKQRVEECFDAVTQTTQEKRVWGVDEEGKCNFEPVYDYLEPSEGDELKIGFNAKFLLEIVKGIDKPTISFSMTEANKAAIIDDNILLMPVMLTEHV